MSAFKLQNLLKELSNTSLVSYTDVDNYQLNGRWVTDIDRNFYEEIAASFLEIIEKNFTKDEFSELKISLLEAKHQSLEKWQDVTAGSNEIHTIIKHYSPKHPINSTLVFLDDPEQEERKRIVSYAVLEFLQLDSAKFEGRNLHSYLLSPEANISEKTLKYYYSLGHLYYVLSIRVEAINGLLRELEETDNIINLNPMKNSNLNTESVQFHLNKKDVTILFHTLHELNLITANENNGKDSQTKLKAWINSSNIYYTSDSGEKAVVKNINRYFSDLNTKYFDKNEIDFLEMFITKLQERLRDVKDRQKK